MEPLCPEEEEAYFIGPHRKRRGRVSPREEGSGRAQRRSVRKLPWTASLGIQAFRHSVTCSTALQHNSKMFVAPLLLPARSLVPTAKRKESYKPKIAITNVRLEQMTLLPRKRGSSNPDGTQTHNLWLRRPVPCSLLSGFFFILLASCSGVQVSYWSHWEFGFLSHQIGRCLRYLLVC